MSNKVPAGVSFARPSVPFDRAPRVVTASGVPVFAKSDAYTRNYDAIARSHLSSLERDGINPFMSDETWHTLDASTLTILKQTVKAGDILLDAGVGLGRLLSAFPEHERYGVDIAFDYLDRTKRLGVHVALASLEELPYPDAAFDCVISTDVLEHVLDFYRATREIERVLKPGGNFVLRVPLEEDMSVYYDYREFDYVHVRRFDLWSLRLHFERILGLEYVLDAPVLPTYRGASTSRLRPIEDREAVQNVLTALPQDLPGRAELMAFTGLTQEIFEAFMNAVSIHHPSDYNRLVALLAGYLEINMVFKKPPSPEGHRQRSNI
ncbi:class I SAM-dependent methyltransferase [Bradyrhizobium sp. 13971]